MSDDVKQGARNFLRGEALSFDETNGLWKALKKADELSLARAVLSHMRRGNALLDRLPAARGVKEELCRQEAMLTSKDPELSAANRHDQALGILAEEFDIDDQALDGDGETLGIAAGICKRRWEDLGQLEDLLRAARLYQRGAGDDLGQDAYCHINAAFLDDLLASTGDQPEVRRQRANALRERIAKDLHPSGGWWNAATRAEALIGLARYAAATSAITGIKQRPALGPSLLALRRTAQRADVDCSHNGSSRGAAAGPSCGEHGGHLSRPGALACRLMSSVCRGGRRHAPAERPMGVALAFRARPARTRSHNGADGCW